MLLCRVANTQSDGCGILFAIDVHVRNIQNARSTEIFKSSCLGASLARFGSLPEFMPRLARDLIHRADRANRLVSNLTTTSLPHAGSQLLAHCQRLRKSLSTRFPRHPQSSETMPTASYSSTAGIPRSRQSWRFPRLHWRSFRPSY